MNQTSKTVRRLAIVLVLSPLILGALEIFSDLRYGAWLTEAILTIMFFTGLYYLGGFKVPRKKSIFSSVMMGLCLLFATLGLVYLIAPGAYQNLTTEYLPILFILLVVFVLVLYYDLYQLIRGRRR